MNKKYKLSICMIVRDEEKFIDNCLISLKPLLDSNLAELIIVDTGSVDNTVEIAKKYTEKIYFKKWNNNFSEARNYSISFAKGEYIFIMDADQDMEKEEVNKLIKLFSSEDYKKYNTYSIIYKNFTSEDLKSYNYFSLNLIFKNDGSFKYDGRIHNQPIYKEPVKSLDIYMNHYGYIMTEDIKEKKFKRTATLLKEELEKDPNNIYYIYQLSRSYEMHGDNKEAILEVEKYMRLIEKLNIDDVLKLTYYHNAMIIYFNSKNYDKCIYYCKKNLDVDNQLIDAYYIMGICYKMKGNIDKCILNLKLYLKYRENFNYKKYIVSNDLEICSYNYKNSVIEEIIKTKLKINQLEYIENYIDKIKLNDKTIYLILGELIELYIKKSNYKELNKLIYKAIEDKEKELLFYKLSYILGNKEEINLGEFLNEIYSLSNSKKLRLKERVELQKKSPYLNFIEFMKENSNSDKVIEIENSINEIIEIIVNVNLDEVLNSKYFNEVIFIIKYLLERVDILIYKYSVSNYNINFIIRKYIELIDVYNENKYEEDKVFVNKLKEFNKYYTKKELKNSIIKLKEAINIMPNFIKLVDFIKDNTILEEKNLNIKIKNTDIINIKKNIVLLISNNLINEVKKVFYELENIYDIRYDSELMNIKAIVNIYSNNLQEAENILKEGIKYYSDNIDLLCNLAYLYEITEQYISSLNIYYDILKLNNINKEEIFGNINRIKKKTFVI